MQDVRTTPVGARITRPPQSVRTEVGSVRCVSREGRPLPYKDCCDVTVGARIARPPQTVCTEVGSVRCVSREGRPLPYKDCCDVTVGEAFRLPPQSVRTEVGDGAMRFTGGETPPLQGLLRCHRRGAHCASASNGSHGGWIGANGNLLTIFFTHFLSNCHEIFIFICYTEMIVRLISERIVS